MVTKQENSESPLTASKEVVQDLASWQGWMNVIIASLLMLGTLPGRTQGLGLITEPLLKDIGLDRVHYAGMNLWATLLGSIFCLPCGFLLDRFGLRWVTALIVLGLGSVVWFMGHLAGGFGMLFGLILLTRALGQSALSVASITLIGKCFPQRTGLAMGAYAVLLSLFFAAAFVTVGSVVSSHGWRAAWQQVALFLLVVILPVVLLLLRETPVTSRPAAGNEATHGAALGEALRTPAFWAFAGATALFGLVSSGLGLFNEAVLAERGFDQKTYHTFLAVTTLLALLGQMACGWLTLRCPMPKLLGAAMFLYAVGLGFLPLVKTQLHLWSFAVVVGLSGGFVTVLFFAIWSHAFGRASLGRIQGAAQMLTVVASAVGPLIFARCAAATGSYLPAILVLAAVVFLSGVWCWNIQTDQRKSVRHLTGAGSTSP